MQAFPHPVFDCSQYSKWREKAWEISMQLMSLDGLEALELVSLMYPRGYEAWISFKDKKPIHKGKKWKQFAKVSSMNCGTPTVSKEEQHKKQCSLETAVLNEVESDWLQPMSVVSLTLWLANTQRLSCHQILCIQNIKSHKNYIKLYKN